ncbi:Alpha/Beta hydrolase protein [Pterulicium gracile]|uniref:Alpha/Beta hydrolase protein n=1 Tax=Pterulicium gracile TaxID=1884261 RepID=A0A5C3QPZ6_9AGAR|nr:Alpha/Beta hydrolase protein [Pterula gracilis]
MSSSACCSIPAVTSDYTPKGTYKSLGDFDKVYVTGTEGSDKALICVFDIFGFFPQTQQGADILASTLGATVYMPDFFAPDGPVPTSRHPPKNKEDEEFLSNFFATTAAPPKAVEKVKAFSQVVKSGGAKRLGLYGFCWGGKVSMLTAADSTVVGAAAVVHPAMFSVDDAEKVQVPMGIYPSKDESKDELEKVEKVLGGKPFASKNDFEYYSTMHHGWAAARADLQNAENKKQFEDVYSRLATFFSSAL